MALLDTRKDEIDYHLSKYPTKKSAVMPLLYIAQDEYGYITPEAVQEIAAILDVDVTHIKGVIGFYTMYYDRPKGQFLIQICTDLPCALKGAEQVSQQACESLGIHPGETTEDGMFTFENVMCLAACDKAPMMQVNFHYDGYEYLDLDKFNGIIEDLRREAAAARPYINE